MLSKRRRISSSSLLRHNEASGGTEDDEDDARTVGSRLVGDPGYAFETPTGTTKASTPSGDRVYDFSWRRECSIVVGAQEKLVTREKRDDDDDVRCTPEEDADDRKRKDWISDEEKCGPNVDVKPLPMSFSISPNSRRLTQRYADNSRCRRRKSSLGRLDRNVEVLQNTSSSTTSPRLAIVDANRGDVSLSSSLDECPRFLERIGDNYELSARISPGDSSSRPSASIYPIIPDNDKTCRRRRELCEDGLRHLNSHRPNDIVMEHKSSRRRKAKRDVARPIGGPNRRKNETLRTSQWACPTSRWIVVFGLFIWTSLVLTEVAARQSHHRTCPGCPHQHVHTINRKSGVFEEGPETSDDPETAPSPDDLRLEAIKHQILTKLGLRTRPDVNRTLASVPRHLALETLYRAEAQPPGHPIELDDDYHGGRRRDHHRHGDVEGEESLSFSSASSPSSSSSKPSSSSSSLSSSSSSSLSSPTLSSKSSSASISSPNLSSSSISSPKSSSSSSPSSSSYGQFNYDGEEYSYRNVDEGALEREASSRSGDLHERPASGSHGDNTRHRGHGDYRKPEKNRDHHVTDDETNDDDQEEGQIEMDDFYARTSEIIGFAEPGRTLNGQPLLEFSRSSGDPALEPLRIKRATLWARVELRHSHHYQHHRRAQSNQRNITLWVFRVRCGNVTHLRGKELGEHLEMVTSLIVNVNQLGWQKFDVTRVVSNWYSGHELTSARNEKLTLLVDCTGCGSHVHVSTFGAHAPHIVESLNPKAGQDPDRPFLVVRTDPAAVKRVRRRAIECSGAIKGQCCKQRFYVSFSQLGWDDWIIAPQGYYANYCRGDCAAGHRTPDTFLNYYTHVIEEYRKMDRLAGMQPCCAPLKFSSMSLIYYGPDSNIIKRDLPKMVVDECGCP